MRLKFTSRCRSARRPRRSSRTPPRAGVQLLQHDILNVPVPATHDLARSLAILPGVVADTNAVLHYDGARVSETEVLLDGFKRSAILRTDN